MKRKFVQITKPAYSKPESPVHCFKTFTDYQKRLFGMGHSFMDLCLMFSRHCGRVDGLPGIQVDDTVCACSSRLFEKEEHGLSEFQVSPSKS